MCQLPGFEVKGHEEKVYKLKKALYGLKQAPRAWNRRIDCFLIQLGFSKCTAKHGVYVRFATDELMIICLYVDNLLITGSNVAAITMFKRRLMAEFDMVNLGLLSYFLGMEFIFTNDGTFMAQKKYATDILRRFHMMNCNLVVTPVDCSIKLEKDGSDRTVDATLYKQIVGSLRFLCNSRPDIAYGVGLISRFMEHPRVSHLLAAKRILRYIKGTLDYGALFLKGSKDVSDEVIGYLMQIGVEM